MRDLLRFLETTGNDLEAPARALQPVIGEVLDGPRRLPGALFARMSGSRRDLFRADVRRRRLRAGGDRF